MANTIRIRRRLAANGAGAPVLTGGNPLRNAELAFNEFSGTLYIGTGGDSAGATAAGAVNAIAGDGAVWTGTATFGTVRATGDVYANSSSAISGKLVATTDYVDSAVSRTTGAGMSLHPVAADCATTGPLTLTSYYNSLAPLLTTNVRVAIPQPLSQAEGLSLLELKGIPNLTYQSPTVQLAAGDTVLVMGHVDPGMIGLWTIPAGTTNVNLTPWQRTTGYETAQGFHFGARIGVTNGTFAGQIFAVLADATNPTKDVAGPSFSSVNFATTPLSVPTGAGILFHKVVRAKADIYTIENGKVVVDGVTLNQNDRFLWTPTTSGDATNGGLTGGTYTNARAGIWRVNYDKATGGNIFNVITRVGDLNETADFVNFSGKQILVREGAANANKIFTASSASFPTVAQEIADTSGSVATFGTVTTFTAAAGSGRTGTPLIDGYQVVIENLAATPPQLGSVVLVKNEIDPVNNGLYYVKIDGAWIRHPSADASGELFYGSYIRVNNGNVNKNSGFVLTSNFDPIVPGTNSLSFESPTALLDFRAGIGLERVGREFRVKAASAVVTVAAGGIDVRAGTTSLSGVVQLEDSTSSTSTVKAATPNSVKSAYDAAAAAQSTANTGVTNAAAAQSTANAALPKAGGTMTGAISFAAGQTWPTFNQNTTGTAAGLSSTLVIGSGGTGQTTAVAAFDALAPTTTIGDLIYFNGSDNVRLAKPSANSVLFNDTAGTVVWNAVTGTTNVVRSTTPTFETSVVNAAASTTFGVFNGACSTLNAFGNATAVNIASDNSFTTTLAVNIGNNLPASGQIRTINIGTAGSNASTSNIVIGAPPTAGTSTTTLQGTVVVSGSLTVNGATTILNTNTLTVDDKNIEIGSVAALTGLTGTVGSVVGNTATISGLVTTGGLVVGMTVTRTSGASTTLGTAATITEVLSDTSISISATSAPVAGGVFFSAGTATDVTAAGGGITLKGGTNKTIIWNDPTAGWEFNQNVTTSGSTVNVNGTNPVIATSQTTGTASVFNTNVPTVNIAGVANDVGIATSATGAGTIAIGTGALASGTRTISIGNGVAAGTLNVNIGSSVASGTTTIASPTVGIGQSGSGTTTINSQTIALNGATISTNVTSGTLALFNTGLTGTLNIGGASTTVTLGGTSTTSLTLGSSNASSTTNIATGAHTTGVTKTVNVGTAGGIGSTTNVNIGSGVAGSITSVSVGSGHDSGGVTINETTTSTSTTTGALIVAGGVGIAGAVFAGGNVTISTGKALNRSLATTLTAAGANQGAALALTNDINIVTTTASGTGVVLPTPTVGRVVVVINRGANPLNVYPAVGHSINGTANSAVVLAANATMIVHGATVTTWFSELTDLTNSAVGTLPVGNGGTGVATLTGLVKGSGTSAFSAATAGTDYVVGGTLTVGKIITQAATATSGTSSLLITASTGTPTAGLVSGDLWNTSGVLKFYNGSATKDIATTDVPGGGTGAATFTSNGLIYGNGTSALGVTAAGSQYQVLRAGSGGTPAFGSINLDQTSAVTGTLPVGNGGTGVATLTGLVKGNGTANFAAATAGTDYLAPPTGTALLKANSGGALANATAGTDYVVAGTATVGGLLLSTTTTITAAGTTQADATVLTNDINVVTTTAASTGVKLPTPAAGRVIAVVNRGANALKVYPATSTAINTLGNNAAFSVAANATLTLRGSSAAQWYAELTAESPCSLVADCTLDGGTF